MTYIYIYAYVNTRRDNSVKWLAPVWRNGIRFPARDRHFSLTPIQCLPRTLSLRIKRNVTLMFR